jgi:hypothetical protein
VAVGGTEVAVGGMGVSVGGSGVAVGGTGVAVGGAVVAAGGGAVAVEGTGVAAGWQAATSNAMTSARARLGRANEMGRAVVWRWTPVLWKRLCRANMAASFG